MMKELAELEQIAKAGKRAESDYGQSVIRRMRDQSNFEDEFTPDVILSLIRELKITREALVAATADWMGPQPWLYEDAIGSATKKLYPEASGVIGRSALKKN
jgi:hypothetical protein